MKTIIRTLALATLSGMVICGCSNSKLQKTGKEQTEPAVETADVQAIRTTDPTKLHGTWLILTAKDTDAQDGMRKAVVTFGSDGRLTGNTSINNFFGNYELTDGNLKCNIEGITMMAGPKMEIESAVRQALDDAHSIVINGNDATVYNSDDNAVMTLCKDDSAGEEE